MQGSHGSILYRLDGPAETPLLVLSNSLGTTSAMWEPQMESFTAYFRVLRYEQRGHGGSRALAGPCTIAALGTDVLGLLDALGVREASVCGLSLGGLVGMWIASHAPERVGRLVLACTAPKLPPPSFWAERAATVRASGTSVLLRGLRERWFTPEFVRRCPDAVQSVADDLARVDPEGYALCCEAIGAADLTEALARITAPTLVLAGAADPVVPPVMALSTQEGIPGSRLLVLPGCAHLANLEQAAAFTSAALEHLLGSQSERGMRARRSVLGDAHVDRSQARTTPFSAGFQDLITRYAWGEIWNRPGLDWRTRSCITLSVLVALGRFPELALHVRAARRNGLSREEIAEVLLHTAIYCGVPAANEAFAVAQQALDETDEG